MAQMVKNLPEMQENWLQSLGHEDHLEKEMATPLQYSCLENPVDRGLWWAIVHGVAKSDMTEQHFRFRPWEAQKHYGSAAWRRDLYFSFLCFPDC